MTPGIFTARCREIVATMRGHEAHRALDLLTNDVLRQVGFGEGIAIFEAAVAEWHKQGDPYPYSGPCPNCEGSPSPPPSGDKRELVERLRELLAKAPSLPWEYRPYKHDDWGWIRGGARCAFGRPIVAAAREGRLLDEGQLDEHRRNQTDPCEPIALLITAAVNALPDLLAELESLQARLSEAERVNVQAREFVVMFLAFTGRDEGTDRITKTMADLTAIAVETDAALIRFISDRGDGGG